MSDVNSQNAIEGRTWQTESAGARAGFVGAAGFASIAFGHPNAFWGEPQSPDSQESRTEKGKEGREMRKRNHVIPVHLNSKELHYLDEQVKKSGFSREEYLRSMIMGAEVRAKPCEHHADLLRKIAGLCNNANQFAYVANASGMAGSERVEEMLRIAKETWKIVKEEW